MRLLNPDFDPARFSERVRIAPHCALLLDYDGTLAPFAPDRSHAIPYPGVREALRAIAGDGRTRLGIVSGRPAEDLARLTALPAGVELWGSHGLEHVPEEGEALTNLAGEVRHALEEAEEWLSRNGWDSLLERKPYGLALHGRGRPELFAAAAPLFLERFSDPLRRAGLEIRSFDGGVEVRREGIHKGLAVERVLAEMGPGTPVAYLGDDETDEDAFMAIRGRGLAVLVRPEERPTGADLSLRPPEELLDFLARWADPEGGVPLLAGVLSGSPS